VGSREVEESDDLLSDYTSETTFFDEERSPSTAGESKDVWQFVYYKIEGKVHIFGEWIARTKSHRYVVIGPDWLCVAMTYIVIVVPSVFVYLYLLENLAEKIVFFILFGLTVFGLTTVFVADPGLVRKYHHARSRHWTYWCVHNEEVICCPRGRRGGDSPHFAPIFHAFRFRFCSLCVDSDHCESFRPPGTVHCSTCQVCVAGYDHHCPVRFVADIFFVLVCVSTKSILTAPPPPSPTPPSLLLRISPVDGQMRWLRQHVLLQIVCHITVVAHHI
jgi:hypothetical protein